MGWKLPRTEAIISGSLLIAVFVALQFTRSSFLSNVDQWMGSSQSRGRDNDTTSQTFVRKGSVEGKKARAFVCITGQLSRLELENKKENLFRHWHDYFGIDFDVALVLSSTNYSSTTKGGESDQEFFHVSEVADYLNTIPGVTVLNSDDFVSSENPVVNPKYFKQRSTDNNRGFSYNLEKTQNQVRQFESLAQCYYHMIQSPLAAKEYDIVHRVREDSGYYVKVPYDKLLKMTQRAHKTIVSSSCQQHGGINDRGSFVSPAAAYDYFVQPMVHMYTQPLPLDVRSTELFLMNSYSKTCHLVETHQFRVLRIWSSINDHSTFYPGTSIPRFLPGTNFDSEKGTLGHCIEGLDSVEPHRNEPRCRRFAGGRQVCVEVA